MDALDHKLSTELTEMKKMLISLHRQIESNANRGYSSVATDQTKVILNNIKFENFVKIRKFLRFLKLQK